MKKNLNKKYDILLGEAVHRKRIAEGWTVAYLAEKLNCSKVTVYALIRQGHTPVTLKAAKLLGINATQYATKLTRKRIYAVLDRKNLLKLRDQRNNLGLSIAELSEITGIEARKLCSFECDGVSLHVGFRAALANALHMETSTLLSK